MLYTLRFFSSKCSLFHNANFFGSCIIHILYTECAEIKKKFRRQRVNIILPSTPGLPSYFLPQVSFQPKSCNHFSSAPRMPLTQPISCSHFVAITKYGGWYKWWRNALHRFPQYAVTSNFFRPKWLPQDRLLLDVHTVSCTSGQRTAGCRSNTGNILWRLSAFRRSVLHMEVRKRQRCSCGHREGVWRTGGTTPFTC